MPPSTTPSTGGSTHIQARIVALADTLRDRLVDEVAGAVHDLGTERCGIVTFTIEGRDAHETKAALRERGINLSVVPPASALLDSTARALPPLLRASVHIYNTHDELDALIDVLA
ncbi:MAG: aminotransferase class V-fold PLP-dependent enzyme [Acidimicrobiales bacterium]